MIRKIFLLPIMLSLFIVQSLMLVPASVSGESVDVFKDVCNVNNNAKEGAACQDKKLGAAGDGNPLYGPDGIITRIVDIISILVGFAAVISIIVAGLRYITSGNNPENVNNSRELIIYAAIGLLVVASAQLLVKFVLKEAL